MEIACVNDYVRRRLLILQDTSHNSKKHGVGKVQDPVKADDQRSTRTTVPNLKGLPSLQAIVQASLPTQLKMLQESALEIDSFLQNMNEINLFYMVYQGWADQESWTPFIGDDVDKPNAGWLLFTVPIASIIYASRCTVLLP